MTTKLMRSSLSRLYEQLCEHSVCHDPHPGLLLQRGLAEHCRSSDQVKARHLNLVCETRPGAFYRRLYARWTNATSDGQQFRSIQLKLRSRLFIGLAGDGILETGCAISHSRGAPYIPGSSVKGAVNAYARKVLSAADRGICDEVFGAPASEAAQGGLAGLVTIHDAWWVPSADGGPFVREVVTPHHVCYYGGEGNVRATDFDSPMPNAQIALRGEFRFVLQGTREWLDVAEGMLVEALVQRGVGAKTRAGYGRFEKALGSGAVSRCDWVDATMKEVEARHHIQGSSLKSKVLADAWSRIGDPQLKDAAFQDLRRRWTADGAWEALRLPKTARQARRIYREYEADGKA